MVGMAVAIMVSSRVSRKVLLHKDTKIGTRRRPIGVSSGRR
jgi:hypothetical protein